MAVLAGALLAAGRGDDERSRSTSAQSGSLAGQWKGAVTERGQTVEVKLTLEPNGQEVAGKFSILSKTGGDIDQGHTVKLARGKRDGNEITFVVPLTGEIDDDALNGQFRLEGGKLVGHFRERRPGSDELPVTFTRAH